MASFCEGCVFLNPGFFLNVGTDHLRCSPQPSGPVGGSCLHYDPRPRPNLEPLKVTLKPKRSPRIKYAVSGTVYSCSMREIARDREEINFFTLLLEFSGMTRHYSNNALQGIYLALEDIPSLPPNSFARRLKALKKKGATQLYLDLRNC